MEGYRVVGWDARVYPRGVMVKGVGVVMNMLWGLLGAHPGDY